MKPPLLFIHGAFTRGQRWQPWLSYFTAAGYECAAPSLPAHDPPDRDRLAGLAFDDYLAEMKAAAAAFRQPPVIVGHSMGGLIAQHVAATTACAGLVLVSSAPPWRGGGRLRAVPYAVPYVLPVLAGWPMRASKRAALDLVLHDLSPREQNELISIFAFESGKAYRTMIFGGAPVGKGAVACPVLVVSGGADRLLRPVVAARLAAFYEAEHLIFPGRGHSLVAESLLDSVAAEVRVWIDRLAEVPPLASFRPGTIV